MDHTVFADYTILQYFHPGMQKCVFTNAYIIPDIYQGVKLDIIPDDGIIPYRNKITDIEVFPGCG